MRRKRDEVMAKARAKRRKRLQRKGHSLTPDQEEGADLGTQVKNAVAGVAETAGDLVKSATETITGALTGTPLP